MKRSEESFQGNHRKRPPSPPTPPARKTHYIVSRLAENHPPEDKNEVLSPATIREQANLEMEARQRTPLSTKQILQRIVVYIGAPLLMIYGLTIDPFSAIELLRMLYDFAKNIT